MSFNRAVVRLLLGDHTEEKIFEGFNEVSYDSENRLVRISREMDATVVWFNMDHVYEVIVETVTVGKPISEVRR